MTSHIRIASAADAAGVAAVYAPSVAGSHTSFEQEPPDAAEMARRIEAVLPTHPWLVCAEGESVLGYAYATPHRARAAYRWTAETSVYVGAAHHRRGIARALYTALFAMLPEQGFALAVAGITLPNAGSVALHESFGFEPVGVYRGIGHKLGAWHDVGWWQRPIREVREAPTPNQPPREPVAFARYRGTPAAGAILACATARLA